MDPMLPSRDPGAPRHPTGASNHPAARARLIAGGLAVTAGLVLAGGFAVASPHDSTADSGAGETQSNPSVPSTTVDPLTGLPTYPSTTTTPRRDRSGSSGSLRGGAQPAPSTRTPTTTSPAPKPRARSHAS
jgi:hypothetical protein